MHNSQPNENTSDEIPLGVRMPWYVAMLNILVSFLAIIDVVILSGFARLFCEDLPVLPGIVSLVFLWMGVKLCIKIWRGSVSAHVVICIMTFFSVLWFAADVPSRKYWGEVGKLSLIFFINCLSVFLICNLPSSAKWLRFRRDWGAYKEQNPSIKTKCLVYESPAWYVRGYGKIRGTLSSVLSWTMIPTLAWPFFILGLCFFVLAYLSYHSEIYSSHYRYSHLAQFDWLTVTIIILGVAFVGTALISFTRSTKNSAGYKCNK